MRLYLVCFMDRYWNCRMILKNNWRMFLSPYCHEIYIFFTKSAQKIMGGFRRDSLETNKNMGFI